MTVGTTFPCKILNNGKEPCEPLMTSYVTQCDMSVTYFFEMLTKSYAPLAYCLNSTYTNLETAA